MLKTLAAPLGKITPDSMRAQMHLSGKQGDQLDRIVLAGKKVMFSKESHQLMLKQLDGPGTIAQKIGQGVAGLIALLWQESHQSLPPQLLIPAGMVLVAIAADFLNQSGQQVTDQDIGQATEAMVTAVLHAGGVNPDKVAEIGASAGKPGAKIVPAKPTAAEAKPGVAA